MIKKPTKVGAFFRHFQPLRDIPSYRVRFCMNKRRFFSGSAVFSRSHVPAYMLCALLLALGIVSGTFLSAGFVESGGAKGFMDGYLPTLRSGSDLGLAQYLLMLSRYPVLAFLLGFSVLGTVGIPVLCFVRGFTLAFALSALTRLYAGNGALMGCMLFGVVSALSVPVFLLVASGAFCSSVRLGRVWFSIPAPMEPDNGPGAYLFRFFLAMLLLLLLAIGERAALAAGLSSLPVFS